MISGSCFLLSIKYTSNSIGVQKETVIKKEVPIIKIEDIRANEFYKANEQGFKPKLRLKISSLSYNDETELEYMGKTYTIIRTQDISIDEIVLVCERKIKNV